MLEYLFHTQSLNTTYIGLQVRVQTCFEHAASWRIACEEDEDGKNKEGKQPWTSICINRHTRKNITNDDVTAFWSNHKNVCMCVWLSVILNSEITGITHCWQNIFSLICNEMQHLSKFKNVTFLISFFQKQIVIHELIIIIKNKFLLFSLSLERLLSLWSLLRTVCILRNFLLHAARVILVLSKWFSAKTSV